MSIGFRGLAQASIGSMALTMSGSWATFWSSTFVYPYGTTSSTSPSSGQTPQFVTSRLPLAVIATLVGKDSP